MSGISPWRRKVSPPQMYMNPFKILIYNIRRMWLLLAVLLGNVGDGWGYTIGRGWCCDENE